MKKRSRKLEMFSLFQQEFFFGQNFSDAKIIRGSKMSGRKKVATTGLVVVTVWLQGSF